MNLAIISNVSGYPWAGSETVWHLSAMQALREGNDVTAIIHSDLMSSEQIVEFSRAGGEVRNWQSLSIARFQSIKEKFAPSFPAKELDGFDVILVSLGSLPSLNYVPGLVEGLLKTKSPVILFCQFNSDHLIISMRERRAVRRVLGKCAATGFLSQRNLVEARRQFAMEPPNSRVIQNPIRNKSEALCPWPDGLKTASFASVARLEVAWKGQDLLLDVLSQPHWRERDWRLGFYGDGPDREYLEMLVGFYKLSDRVFFEGHVKDLKSIWAHNHLLVMPSHGEGMPLTALEAMMAGRPVVATDVGGNAEIIRDGETGFIAEGATLHSFSQAMERAWRARNRWSEMGSAARRAMIERLDIDPSKELLKICVSVARSH